MIENNETYHVTEDDEPFLIQQELVGNQLDNVRAELEKVSLTTVCIECAEDIGKERKAAVPSATRCIDCETALQERKARNARR